MPTLRSHNDNVCCDRTVSQNDQGILPGFSLSHLPTVVVLSSGGYGHIELPLIKGSIPQANESTAAFKKTVPYKHVVSFAGDTGTAPNQLRIRMQRKVRHLASTLNFSAAVGGKLPKHEYQRRIQQSKVSLSPRGYGRSSFRSTEVRKRAVVLYCFRYRLYDHMMFIPH